MALLVCCTIYEHRIKCKRVFSCNSTQNQGVERCQTTAVPRK